MAEAVPHPPGAVGGRPWEAPRVGAPVRRGERPRVLVVGGGHAGVEAALAAVRAGAEVVLTTLDPRAIGRMSCNPSVGGLAKGQLVREIDALGGLMGIAADAACTQFRMLNTRKGPAVRSPRAQVDREAYAAFVAGRVAAEPRITVVAGQVADLRVAGGRCRGLGLADGRELHGDVVVLTTGTFLRGLMHVGERRSAGGRVGEAPAALLSARLVELDFELVRLKTGTPPRVDAASLDLGALPTLHEHEPGRRFSFRVRPPAHRPRRPTYRSATTGATHDIVRRHLQRSPYGRGALEGVGPRYCPSLEDKVVRFADKPEHRVFVEHETADGPSLYLNGLSNCLPAEVQVELVRSLPGFDRARLLRPGYAVEYDAAPAWQLHPTLESRGVPGLFLAGQINGTSGYEEAAAQGLMAGLNAARAALGLPGAVLGRHEAYIGVLVDDLVTSSPREPYRMFTSRAEYRLLLRQDNADRRLMPRAREWGLIDADTWEAAREREARIGALAARLDAEGRRRLRAGEGLGEVLGPPASPDDAEEAGLREQVEFDVRYAGYVERQQRSVARLAELSAVALPADLDYAGLGALRREAREVLARLRPANLGQASRLAGVTPSDLSALALCARRRAGRPAPA